MRRRRAKSAHVVVVGYGVGGTGRRSFARALLNGKALKKHAVETPHYNSPLQAQVGQRAWHNGNILHVTTWSIGNSGDMPPLWEGYAKNATCLVFVVNASPKGWSEFPGREAVLRAWDHLLSKEWAQRLPLLLVANFSDVEGALSAAMLAEAFSARAVTPWHSMSCSAKSGDGVRAVVEWSLSPRSTPTACVASPAGVALECEDEAPFSIRAVVLGDDDRAVRRLILFNSQSVVEADGGATSLDGSQQLVVQEHVCRGQRRRVEWQCWDLGAKVLASQPSLFWNVAAPEAQKVQVAIVVTSDLESAVRWAVGYRQACGFKPGRPIVLAWCGGDGTLTPNSRQAMVTFAAVERFDPASGDGARQVFAVAAQALLSTEKTSKGKAGQPCALL
jgi:hypothetical protein